MKQEMRKKIKILDRSDFPWVFATKKLASYVAHILRDKMRVACAFSYIEKVAGYNPKSPLRIYYHNNCDMNRGIPDSNIVDDAYNECKMHKFKLVEIPLVTERKQGVREGLLFFLVCVIS